jgi:hypothetical protein
VQCNAALSVPVLAKAMVTRVLLRLVSVGLMQKQLSGSVWGKSSW